MLDLGNQWEMDSWTEYDWCLFSIATTAVGFLCKCSILFSIFKVILKRPFITFCNASVVVYNETRFSETVFSVLTLIIVELFIDKNRSSHSLKSMNILNQQSETSARVSGTWKNWFALNNQQQLTTLYTVLIGGWF